MPTTALVVSSASESGMPPPPQPASRMRPRDFDAGAIEEREHLRAAVVLEQRVVVLRAEATVAVGPNGLVVNLSHDEGR